MRKSNSTWYKESYLYGLVDILASRVWLVQETNRSSHFHVETLRSELSGRNLTPGIQEVSYFFV
jgi:hypothetical protein